MKFSCINDYLKLIIEWNRVMIKESEINQSDLFITEAYVDEGPSMKRFRPRAMGRASSIIKRSCHLTITLENKNS